MNTGWLKLFTVLWVLCAFAAPAHCQRTSTAEIERLRAVNYVGQLNGLAAKLAESCQVTIGLDAARQDPKSQVSVEVRDANLRDVLTAIARSGRGDRWRWTGNGTEFDLYPASGRSSVLDIEIAALRLREADWVEAIAALTELPEVRSGMAAANLSLRNLASAGAPKSDGHRFSLELEKLTVRRALHEIAKKSGSHIWVFQQHGAAGEYLSITNTP
jgi:hypothetical protein